MVYIDRYGRVFAKRPWDLNRVIEICIGLWILVVHFFVTLFAPFRTVSVNNRNGSGWSSNGGGRARSNISGGESTRYDGLRPNRRLGRIQNSMDCNIPGGG